MLKSEDYEVGEFKFSTTQFPAMRAFELMTQLAKTIGPALAALQSLDKDTELSALGPILSSALSNLTKTDATALVLDILAGTQATVPGPGGQRTIVQLTSRAALDAVFSARLKMMFQVLGHAIKVNYADFSEGSDPAAPTTQELPAS